MKRVPKYLTITLNIIAPLFSQVQKLALIDCATQNSSYIAAIFAEYCPMFLTQGTIARFIVFMFDLCNTIKFPKSVLPKEASSKSL